MTKPRGAILLVVLVMVAMASMVVVGLLYRVQAEVRAATATGNGQQAYAAAMSGLQYSAAVIKRSGGDLKSLEDNPKLFRNKLVCEDGVNQWYFTVYAPTPPRYDKPRFGVIDEASKININTADEAMLQSLLHPTAARHRLNEHELVDCLLDYIDADDQPRPDGSEQEESAGGVKLVKNRPLATLEEILLVKGFDARVVYGDDRNFNGLLDADEDDQQGELDTGLMNVATTFTVERIRGGQGRVDLNRNGDLRQLGLSDQAADFVAMYCAEGNRLVHPSQLLEMKYTLKTNPRDFPQKKAGMEIESGVGRDELPLVMEKTIASANRGRGAMSVGLVNVNTASARVLTALLADDSLATRIAELQPRLSDEKRRSTAWLYTEGIVEADAYKTIAPKLTATSTRIRVRCVGFGWPCAQYRVLEAVIDTSRANPRIIYLRDLTSLGLPFAMELEKETY